MSVNWRDIQEKAEAFILEYKGASKEDSEAKAFWIRFFDIFGVRERSVGLFEKRVKLLKGGDGKIDFFAPGRFLIEHKSLNRDLDKAFEQAAEYIDALPEDDKPRYLILCDFDTFRLYDFEAQSERKGEVEFNLKDLPQKVQLFSFLTDEKVRIYKEEDPINIKAVRAIGRLYEAVRTTNHFTPEEASKLLTRLVFTFFADDIGIFNANSMRRYFEENTKADGTDIGAHIGQMFQVLDMDDGTGKEDTRPSTIHPALADLPYVNGGLFGADLKALFGSREIRDELLKCMAFDWSRISPEIFGSMFQSVMDDDGDKRHDLGAHYTSEVNIRKVIDGLFLDELKAELEAAKRNEAKLHALWDKIAKITLLDPACGCGNFLVVSYRELRAIENEIIARLYARGIKRSVEQIAGHGQLDLGEVDLQKISKLSIERMYGIEIEPFAAEVAKLSLWVVDHMMNAELGKLFGKPLKKLPLREAPHIVPGNALTLDWEAVVPKEKLTHILGNPPFLGSKVMTDDQRAEVVAQFEDIKGAGTLDFVTAWYAKAGKYIKNTIITCAFVSTNSITQGEQVAILWKYLIENQGVHIRFAHRTFKWSNEAKGKAAVYCVIIGFGLPDAVESTLYEYDDIKGEPRAVAVKHINPYLVNAPDVFIESRSKPLCDVPEIGIGNKPIDGGLYLFSTEEKQEFLRKEPNAERFFRRWLGSDEFINGYERWCLWLGNARPEELRVMPEVMSRIEGVKQFRLMSKSAPTRKLAEHPTKFHVENIPTTSYLLIPRVSSEKRIYVPIGFIDVNTLSSDSVHIVESATLYHFGVLESEMHMVWMRAICGRLESRYRYSKDIVYNNFPWPQEPSDAQKREVEEAAQGVLDARAAHPGATLADLYDPITMPKDLLDAHHRLDRAVDACYGKRSFKNEPERLEFLFDLYKKLINE